MSNAPPKMTPDPDGLSAEFYRHLAEGTLCLRRCEDCGVSHHPPRYLCGACGSERVTWSPASGKGRLFSWTITHRPLDPGWAVDGPWATLVVEMEEGPRLVGGFRGGSHDDLELDLPMKVEIDRESETFARLCFLPDR